MWMTTIRYTLASIGHKDASEGERARRINQRLPDTAVRGKFPSVRPPASAYSAFAGYADTTDFFKLSSAFEAQGI
jgi:hypothetical protein